MADRIVVMNQGVIEQIGTPFEIYRSPATPFVADFVGEMNILDGVLVDNHRVRVGTTELACEAADGLAPGAEVKVCFRPEDVDVRSGGAATTNLMPVEIVALDFLGSFYRATLKPAAVGTAVVRADVAIHLQREFDLAPGKAITVSLPADHIRVFPKG